MVKINLYLMGEKGFHVLKNLESKFGAELIDYVVSEKDKNVLNDFYDEIKSLCLEKKIPFFKRTESFQTSRSYSFAVGWRYLILEEEKLIVFHDSLLPRYRGFNPLVTALINGDDKVGVTALLATSNYDCGDIVKQKTLYIKYPTKIAEVISKIKFLYSDIAREIVEELMKGNDVSATKQDESLATYSLWRDELDYFIDWNCDASQISRLIDAAGAPYSGAQTYCDGIRIQINEAIPLHDLVIENRITGKVIKIEDSFPVVVCGSGLLKILEAKVFLSDESIIPLKKFRTRFSNVTVTKRNH